MNVNESRKTNAGGKRGKPLYALFVVSLIAAFVIAILPMSSAFAAPVGPGGSDSKNDGWESKVRNLRSEMAISSNLQTQPGQSCVTAADARYRDQYIATL